MPIFQDGIIAAIRYGSEERNPMINVTYWTASGIPTDKLAFPREFSEALFTSVKNQLAACLGEDSSVFGVDSKYYDAGVVYTGVSYGASVDGIQQTDELPAYAAAVIQKRTATPGKEGRGRWYIGGVPEGATNQGRLTDADIGTFSALATKLITPLTVDGVLCEPRHWSEKLGALLPITGVTVNSILGTMRRRRLRPAF